MPSRLRVTAAQVCAFRARKGCLECPRPEVELAAAAWGGLQDTAPRSALLSLHARAAAVGPASWADSRLAQVWGPRLAVYLVPAADAPVFTLGRLPRDPRQRRGLERMTDAVLAALDPGGTRVSDVFTAVGDRPGHRVRAASATGRYLLRWNASSNVILPAPAASLDPEQAGSELVRRYLGWLGPGTLDSFTGWAGVLPADAATAWAAIEPETAEVEVGGHVRRVLTADVDVLRGTEPAQGVRLLPPNDPYLRQDKQFLVDSAAHFDALYRAKKAAAGALFVDGEIVGTWTRRQHRVGLRPWRPLSAGRRDALIDAAHRLAGPMGRAIDLAPMD